MNTSAPRWFFRIEIGPRWELDQALLMDFPVEAIVEGAVEARVYFADRAAAAACAAAVAPGEEIECETADGTPPVFGDGTHPTTRICLDLMDAFTFAGRRVADIGSGTGILAAEAARRGATLVVAADLDEPAAQSSASALSGWPEAHALQGGAEALAGGRFDVVLVNLHLAALRHIWPEIERIAAPGGEIVVSGLAGGQAAEVEHLAAPQRRARLRLRRDGWEGFILAAAFGWPRAE